MTLFDSKPAALATIVAAGMLGSVSMTLFGIFLFRGPFPVVDLGLGETAIHFWNVALSLLFFLQHSLMVRPGVCARWLHAIPEHSRRAWYAIASGLALLPVVLFWQPSEHVLLEQPAMLWWFVLPAWILGGAIMAWGLLALRADMLGVEPILGHLRGRTRVPEPFVVRGPYRLVRHPLYLGALLMIWAGMHVSVDRLVFNGVWTAWILVGTWLEERDLVAEFGDSYRRYRREVPMLWPARLPISSRRDHAR